MSQKDQLGQEHFERVYDLTRKTFKPFEAGDPFITEACVPWANPRNISIFADQKTYTRVGEESAILLTADLSEATTSRGAIMKNVDAFLNFMSYKDFSCSSFLTCSDALFANFLNVNAKTKVSYYYYVLIKISGPNYTDRFASAKSPQVKSAIQQSPSAFTERVAEIIRSADITF